MIWASEPRISLVSTCTRIFLSYPFCLLFLPDLSITNYASCRNGVTGGPCKHSSEIDRQVRKLIVVQDTSAEAQRYSSYTLPAPPSRTPSSLLVRSPPSFIRLQIAFSPLLMLLESQGACRISLAALEKFPQYWFGLAKPAGFPSAPVVTRLKRTSQPAPAHVISCASHKFQFYVCGILCLVFGGLICIIGQKATLWPPGFIQGLLGVMELLPCTVELIAHQYAFVSFIDIFDYAVKVNDLTEVQAVWHRCLFLFDWGVQGGVYSQECIGRFPTHLRD